MEGPDAVPSVGVDYETKYTKEYSLRKMSTWNYVFHEQFDAYTVSVYCPEKGIEYVGHPREFQWKQINGFEWIHHNASFDWLVSKRLREVDRIIPEDVNEVRIFDTADMAAYLGMPRNLKGAAKQLLDFEADKAMRDFMRGREVSELNDDEKRKLDQYAMTDSVLCHRLRKEFGHLWPADEQELSALNRLSCVHGVAVNMDLLDTGIRKLGDALHNSEKHMLWIDRGFKPLSPNGIREQGRLDGIPVPASLAATDETAMAWEKQYAEQFPWVKAIRNYRRINTMLQKMRNLKAGTRTDKTFYFQMKYFGCTTGRFSGGGDSGGKYNMLNQYRKELFEVTTRNLFIARPGKKLVVVDYSQIEAILLLWRVGDQATLDFVRSGASVYEAYARKNLGWTGGDLKKTGEKNPEADQLYRLAKACVLGGGYQAWAASFQRIAKTMAGLDFTLERCEEIVREYRAANPKIVQFWAEHQRWAELSARQGDPYHEVVLASGRSLKYHEPTIKMKRDETFDRDRLEIRASFVKGEPKFPIYGGLLTENEIQATARDVLRDGWLALNKAGYQVLFTVYDEYVTEVDEATAEEDLVKINKIATTCSPWLGDNCPLGTDSHIMTAYSK